MKGADAKFEHFLGYLAFKFKEHNGKSLVQLDNLSIFR